MKSVSLQICSTLVQTCPIDEHAAAAQVVSMAADNVIKVWDLRNHRCIQTITDLDWPSQEDAHPCVMMYDPARCSSKYHSAFCHSAGMVGDTMSAVS